MEPSPIPGSGASPAGRTTARNSRNGTDARRPCRPAATPGQLLASILEREHQRGRIHVEHPTEAARTFLGALMGATYPSALPGANVPSRRELDGLNREVCRTFLQAWMGDD
ncbi:TetR/AcrR family transcriptional regulator C-terminal domain-containing protein [Zestomonas carbonaria]|uniref:TetR/AcrR family transcriptional regulator C-terminal domain-containing protein n=1 Tax=Zestomonas carbonaria TaxID=2762745 RepID=UPI0038B42D99